MLSTSVLRRALVVTVLATATLAAALPANAHAALVSSDPEDGATVEELTAIRLEFSEELIEVGNSIIVTDGAGVAHELEPTIAEPTVLEAEVPEIAPGEVQIAWRSASVDGHTEEGLLTVTLLEPSPSPSASAPASPTPVATPSETAAAPSPSPSPSATLVEDSGVSPWLWALLGLVVIGGAGAALFAATRRPPTES